MAQSRGQKSDRDLRRRQISRGESDGVGGLGKKPEFCADGCGCGCLTKNLCHSISTMKHW